MRVPVQSDVRERVPVADEVLLALEVALERPERAVARRHSFGKPVGEGFGLPGVRDPEADDGDRGLEVVLLEEHPLQHLGTLVRVIRNESRAFAEVPEDRARLAERPSVVEHERRHAQ